MKIGLLFVLLSILCACATKSIEQEAARLPNSEDGALHPDFEIKLANEAELQAQIIKGFEFVRDGQRKAFGKPLRGTHSKGVCVRGEFEILNNPSDLSIGVFANRGTYPALIRFANAAGAIADDKVPDVRAVSISVELPTSISNPQGKMDFSFNNATTFPINDGQVFADIFIASAVKDKDQIVKMIGPARAMAVMEALANGEKQKAPAKEAYQRMTYWSGVPFLFGRDQAVKYKLKPYGSNMNRSLPEGNANKLSDELKRHISDDQKMSRFDFQVQILDAAKLKFHGEERPASFWVENATAEWSEQQIPFQSVARLTLLKGSALSDQECEQTHFNTNLNTTDEHVGLGSINRLRTKAEEDSATKR